MKKVNIIILLIVLVLVSCVNGKEKTPGNLSIVIDNGNSYEYLDPKDWNPAHKGKLLGVVVSDGEQAFIVKLKNEKLTKSQVEEVLKNMNFDNNLSEFYLSKLREQIPTWEDQQMTAIDAVAIHGKNLPTYDQAKLMISNHKEIDEILSLIGGTPLGNNGYWTGTGNNSGRYYEILFWNDEPLYLGNQENTCLVREVITLK